MTSDTTTITLPFPPDALIVIALACVILFGSYIIFSILPRDPDRHFKSPLRRVAEGLGFRVDTADQAAVLFTAMLGYLLLFAFAMAIAVRMLGGMAIGPLTGGEASPDQGTSLGFGALLAAILGAPFIIWRSWIAAKQAAIAEEALFNDKINAAATDLAARRQVTKAAAPGGSYEKHQDFWEDDLVTRAAAIDRLEGLAKDSIKDSNFEPARRIARMLSIYVQELSRAYPARPAPEFQSRVQIRNWAATLRPVARPDMERAVQSLGRINPTDKTKRAAFDPRNIDLRRCNLQGFDLRGLNFQGVWFDHAFMQGCDLIFTRMEKASLDRIEGAGIRAIGAQMQKATLASARLQGGIFAKTDLQDGFCPSANFMGAYFGGARLQNAYFAATRFEYAYLGGAEMQETDFTHARLDGSYLGTPLLTRGTKISTASLRGSCLVSADSAALELLQKHWSDTFGVFQNLPENAPAHWVQASEQEIKNNTYRTQWRAWAATLDPPVTIAPDYDPD